MEKSAKLKIYLDTKIKELSIKIRKLKRKYIVLRLVHGSLLIISISSATVVTIIAPLLVPPLIIACVASISSISAIFSMRFDLNKKKEKHSNAIKQLNILKDKLDYVVSCNGSMSEEECNNILREFREK